MKLVRLYSISDTYFSEAWELYLDAFPLEERKSLDEQINILKREDYHFDVFIDKNEFVGFVLWWNFKTYKYIDHFAVSVQQRNKGVGKLILSDFVNDNSKPVLLEVELPSTTINERRIKFYERIGFKLNQHHYTIPPNAEGQASLPLLVMTYPNFITKKDVEQFVKTYHPIVFNIEL